MAKKKNQQITNSFEWNQGHYFLILLLCLTLFGCFNILQPYINPIILAIILAIVFNTIHKKIEVLVKGKKNIAAIISCTLLILVVVLPLTFLFFALIQQGIISFNSIYDWISSGNYKKLYETSIYIKIKTIFDYYLPDIKKYFPDINLNEFKIEDALLKFTTFVGQFLLNQVTNIVGNITTLIGKFFLMIFAFFFIIRDQEKITEALFHLIPLTSSHEKKIIQNIREVSRSVILGTAITAIAQGAIAGIAFWICSLPALFWGTVMSFASLIPMVGTSLIWLPASIYLFLSGKIACSIFMIIWCALVVGMIDNFLRPLFMKGSSDMSTFLIFFSILGGLNYFGLIGILYGPLIFGIAMVLLFIYSLEFQSFLKSQDKK